jgi:ABC-2 type transport system permease protein
VGTIYVVQRIATQICRVGILMYGKRPTLREMARWLSYA